MKPIKEVGRNIKANINLAPGNSGAEESLPVYYAEGVYTSRWKLTLIERLKVMFSGSIWLSIMGTGHPPVRLDMQEPFIKEETGETANKKRPA